MPDKLLGSAQPACEGDRLFTFAIISDTHVRPPGGDESSPFPVNLLANGRARQAVALIVAEKPELTFHLGDMVHPMPSLPTFGPAAAEAKRILAPLGKDLHYVPGNHDVGDKPLKGLPAEFASEESLALYEQAFGAPWYAVAHGGCRFIILNSSIMNSGLEAERLQRQWLERELAAPDPSRTFVLIHYPPYITQADEPSHYDNIDEPARSWLLEQIAKARVEAVFSGHVHHFFFNRLAGCHLYVLPPTSFIRQDYAELFPIEPALEYGRNDTGKFGVTLVDVHERGHRVRILPTDGRERDEAAAATAAATAPAGAARGAPLVAHMRHAWARAIDLPYNGPMEEFSRKSARNDALLKRLWQMGIRRVRTPLADLLDPVIRQRIADFHAAGITFTFFTLQVPGDPVVRLLETARHLTDALQIVASRTDLSDIADGLEGLLPADGVPIIVGKLHSSADEPKHGSHFAHAVSFGFKWHERDAALDALKAADKRRLVSGLAFQINLGDDAAARLGEIEAFAARHDITASANVRLADENPATANFDDALVLRRVRAVVKTAAQLTRTCVEVDTLIDVDRGYHPRHGLLDRRCNFRPAGRWLAGLDETN
ncbi:MAG: metallophosphoesterase [Hyphomicrobiaceae bacterium]